MGTERQQVFPSASLPLVASSSDKTVELPTGWSVVSKSLPRFDAIVKELTASGWGAPALAVQNDRGGFDAYRTTLASDGLPGSLQQVNVTWASEEHGRFMIDCRRGR